MPFAGTVLLSSSSQELRSEEHVAWKPALGFLRSLHTDYYVKSKSDSKYQSMKERKKSDSQSLASIALGYTPPCRGRPKRGHH